MSSSLKLNNSQDSQTSLKVMEVALYYNPSKKTDAFSATINGTPLPVVPSVSTTTTIDTSQGEVQFNSKINRVRFLVDKNSFYPISSIFWVKYYPPGSKKSTSFKLISNAQAAGSNFQLEIDNEKLYYGFSNLGNLLSISNLKATDDFNYLIAKAIITYDKPDNPFVVGPSEINTERFTFKENFNDDKNKKWIGIL